MDSNPFSSYFLSFLNNFRRVCLYLVLSVCTRILKGILKISQTNCFSFNYTLSVLELKTRTFSLWLETKYPKLNLCNSMLLLIYQNKNNFSYYMKCVIFSGFSSASPVFLPKYETNFNMCIYVWEHVAHKVKRYTLHGSFAK